MSTNQTTQFYKHGLGKCYVQIPLYLFVYLGTLLIQNVIPNHGRLLWRVSKRHEMNISGLLLIWHKILSMYP